jgi:protein-arginine kinase activator protein McsA
VQELDFESAAIIRDELLTLMGEEVPKKPSKRGRK